MAQYLSMLHASILNLLTKSSITFQNIAVQNAQKYGIVIEQDYLNSGPTGEPTNGVKISGVTVTNVTGTADKKARDYYILCGSDSCTNFNLNAVNIVGGEKRAYC